MPVPVTAHPAKLATPALTVTAAVLDLLQKRLPPAAGETVSVTLESAAPSVRVTTQPAGAAVTVDGNDPFDMYAHAHAAIERARAGEGPTLLECKTYRWYGHSRSDPRAYRTKEEEAAWKALRAQRQTVPER